VLILCSFSEIGRHLDSSYHRVKILNGRRVKPVFTRLWRREGDLLCLACPQDDLDIQIGSSKGVIQLAIVYQGQFHCLTRLDRDRIWRECHVILCFNREMGRAASARRQEHRRQGQDRTRDDQFEGEYPINLYCHIGTWIASLHYSQGEGRPDPKCTPGRLPSRLQVVAIAWQSR